MTVTGASENSPHPLATRARHFVSIVGMWIAALARAPRVPLSAVAFLAERQRLRVGAIATVLTVIVAMGWCDAAAIRAAAQLPSWVNETYNEITDYGRSSWFLWPSCIFFLVTAAVTTMAATRMSRLVLTTIAVRLGFIFLAIGVPGLLVTIVKRWIGRVRPSELGPFAYHPFSWDPAYASLPSGHSAAAFSALVALGCVFPRARLLLWIYAVTIAMSRVIIAAHYPSDVIAGAAVGAFGAVLVREWFAARRLGFTVGSDGQVRAMPGPSLKRIKKVARALAAQ
jgi:membrane-associated phospholipid phosphatase